MRTLIEHLPSGLIPVNMMCLIFTKLLNHHIASLNRQSSIVQRKGYSLVKNELIKAICITIIAASAVQHRYKESHYPQIRLQHKLN
jgi:hypothetical protein